MSDSAERLEKKAKEIFDDLYEKFDKRVKDLSNQFKDNIIPETEEKLRKNVFKSVFISFGIGFIVGILVVVFGFNGGKKR